MTGIAPDVMQEHEQGETAEKDQKLVRQKLLTAYETNISTRLKADLCGLDVSNHINQAKEVATSELCKTNIIVLDQLCKMHKT